MTVLILGIVTVLVPTALALWLVRGRNRSRWEWAIALLLVGNVCFLFFEIGPWAITSYYLRYVVIALFFSAAVYSYFKSRTLPVFLKAGIRGLLVKTMFVAATVGLNIVAVVGKVRPHDAVTLAFPLKNGAYYILQGGVTWVANPFHSLTGTGKYAVDVVQIDGLGNRAATFIPKQPAQYHIFGANLYSPCDGTVKKAVGHLMDNVPPAADWDNSAGNHLVIECDGIEVTLMHLRTGSLKAAAGDAVTKGQLIGAVGNSGYSDEPHLHVQANTVDGRPVAIVFDGRFLAINDIHRN